MEINFLPLTVTISIKMKSGHALSGHALVVVLCRPFYLNTSFIHRGLVLLQNLNNIELVICSKRSFTGSQLIVSNLIRPISPIIQIQT